jgi:hypothetical protein
MRLWLQERFGDAPLRDHVRSSPLPLQLLSACQRLSPCGSPGGRVEEARAVPPWEELSPQIGGPAPLLDAGLSTLRLKVEPSSRTARKPAIADLDLSGTPPATPFTLCLIRTILRGRDRGRFAPFVSSRAGGRSEEGGIRSGEPNMIHHRRCMAVAINQRQYLARSREVGDGLLLTAVERNAAGEIVLLANATQRPPLRSIRSTGTCGSRDDAMTPPGSEASTAPPLGPRPVPNRITADPGDTSAQGG